MSRLRYPVPVVGSGRGLLLLSAAREVAMTVGPERIKTKRIYEPKADADGARLLVDRIWPRGVSKEHAALDAWLKDVAPSNELRHWFNHEPKRWEEFCRRYTSELQQKGEEVSQVLDFAMKGNVTLLYAASDDEHNNAVALRAFLIQCILG
ncbi:DUF488 domain-containing protein [Rhizobium sp. KDH_Rht_773_N]